MTVIGTNVTVICQILGIEPPSGIRAIKYFQVHYIRYKFACGYVQI